MSPRRAVAIVADGLIAAALILVAVRAGLSQTVSTWNGSIGNWTDAIRWSTNPFYPNNGNGAVSYRAVIGAGDVNLNADIALAAVQLNGGLLGGTGNLTAADLVLN